MTSLPHTLGFIGNVGWTEIIVLALLGVLIFGRRLPEVGRSIGKGIVEFKKGLAGIDDDVKQQTQHDQPDPNRLESSDRSDTISTSAPTQSPTSKES